MGSRAASERPRVAHCRIRIPPEFGKQRHAACTPATPALTQKANLKPPHARQLASRRQLKFPSEWRLLSTLLKHARGAAMKLNHEVQPRRPTTPGARAHADAPARGPSAIASKSFFSRAFQPPSSFPPENTTAEKSHCHLQRGSLNSGDSSLVCCHHSLPPPQDFRFAPCTLPN